MAENEEGFELKLLDPPPGSWADRWDTSQVSGQPGRLPFEVYIKLSLRNVKGVDEPLVFQTKVQLPMTQGLKFGVMQ